MSGGHGRWGVSGGATIELPLAADQQYLRGELGVYADSVVGSGEGVWRTNHEINILDSTARLP